MPVVGDTKFHVIARVFLFCASIEEQRRPARDADGEFSLREIMATQYESARLILELYNLRREATMREARSFWVTFNPETVEDLLAAGSGPNGAHVRMVVSYWEMACSLVLNGAIDQKMFHDANGEHLLVFSKVEHLIPAWRERMGDPTVWKSLETVALSGPDARKKIDAIRERLKAMQAARAR
jgi:hypothetical protein